MKAARDGTGGELSESWDGNGITSSAVLAHFLTTLAVVDNSDPFAGGFGYTGSPTGPMEGVEVPVKSVVVKYTYGGDVFLNGRIDADDYNVIDTFFANYWDNNAETMTAVLPGGPSYQMGDFNMDGVINADDYNIIDTAYANQDPPETGWGPYGPLGHVGAVPEPATLSLLALGAAAMITRRRRAGR